MTRLRAFPADSRGTTAAEFALVVPIMILFLLGLIDVGRYAWEFNKSEKATQIGARWAVATDMIPSGLIDYSFAVSGGIPQGTVVPQSAFPGVTCVGGGTPASPSVSCSCPAGGQCGYATTGSATAFTVLYNRMRQINQRLLPSQIQVNYDWSGLGFAGDPNGPDVMPFVTVRLTGQQFPLLFALGRTVSLPSASYTLTLEDGQGTTSN